MAVLSIKPVEVNPSFVRLISYADEPSALYKVLANAMLVLSPDIVDTVDEDNSVGMSLLPVIRKVPALYTL